ncbi:hypothetical protein EVA_10583 [gut metagenome]|uniref:Uncharacterized protein n=1 Tax=gut metagenome TaxID=749906 RepID=J9CMI2_9ZZZZ
MNLTATQILTIHMTCTIMMTPMILQMNGQKNLGTGITMVDMMMLLITGRMKLSGRFCVTASVVDDDYLEKRPVMI